MISDVQYGTDCFMDCGIRRFPGEIRMPHFVSTARLAPSHLDQEQSPLVHMAVPFLDSMA